MGERVGNRREGSDELGEQEIRLGQRRPWLQRWALNWEEERRLAQSGLEERQIGAFPQPRAKAERVPLGTNLVFSRWVWARLWEGLAWVVVPWEARPLDRPFGRSARLCAIDPDRRKGFRAIPATDASIWDCFGPWVWANPSSPFPRFPKGGSTGPTGPAAVWLDCDSSVRPDGSTCAGPHRGPVGPGKANPTRRQPPGGILRLVRPLVPCPPQKWHQLDLGPGGSLGGWCVGESAQV